MLRFRDLQRAIL